MGWVKKWRDGKRRVARPDGQSHPQCGENEREAAILFFNPQLFAFDDLTAAQQVHEVQASRQLVGFQAQGGLAPAHLLGPELAVAVEQSYGDRLRGTGVVNVCVHGFAGRGG